MGELSVFIVQLYFIIKKIKASVEDKNWKKKTKTKTPKGTELCEDLVTGQVQFTHEDILQDFKDPKF